MLCSAANSARFEQSRLNGRTTKLVGSILSIVHHCSSHKTEPLYLCAIHVLKSLLATIIRCLRIFKF